MKSCYPSAGPGFEPDALDGWRPGIGPTDDDVNAVAKQLFCPVCENIPLDTCGTAACEQWRGIIREKLSEGWTEDQIKNYFVEQYGDRVLAEPPAQGFNWVVYLVPAGDFYQRRLSVLSRDSRAGARELTLPTGMEGLIQTCQSE